MKNKKIGKLPGVTLVIFTLVMIMSTTGTIWAGRGMGPGDGTGPVTNIFDGIAVEITGTVSAVGLFGQGYQIDTGTEVVTVFGFGPIRFWNSLGIDRPTVGEEITIEGYEITFSDGSTKIIAFSVIVGDESVVLRDAESGAPLWRGNASGECRGECGGQGDGKGAAGIPGQGDRDRLRDGSCLTP
jgi:hypothetical protein